MRRRSRIAAATTAAVLAASSLLVGAVSSSAAGPPIESYQTGGQARGIDVSFTFTGSIFERLLDLGFPHARSNVNSEGGGASRSAAAQLFPGDLVAGQAGEQFPGYRYATFPKEKDPASVEDDAHFTDTFRFPGAIPPGGGPVYVDNAHIITTAKADSSTAKATTNLATLGPGTPLLSARSLESTSKSLRQVDHVDHVATSIVRDLEIRLSDALSVNVGQLVSVAHTRSDGLSPTAETSLKLSGVTVTMNGTTYDATIDQSGISITGAPKIPLPSPLPADPLPGTIPQNLNQSLAVLLEQAKVSIATASGTKTVDEASGDASLDGLLITFTGILPGVFVPDVVAQVVDQIKKQLPEEVQKRLAQSICLERDIKPLIQSYIDRLPPELKSAIPGLPLCLSENVVPGPGSGVITTIAIGAVRSASVAVQSIPITGLPPGDPGAFPSFGVDPGLGGEIPGGFPQAPGDPGAGGAQNGGRPLVRTGLVARLPSAALLVSGAVFLLLAMGLAMGPSLRGWRPSRET